MFTDRRANTLQVRRERQPWPKDVPFKILALDGGGIRGVYSAEFLKRCETAFGKGEKLASYFDMITGTSTGGIIALGLGLGISTADIVSFYEADGRTIFPPLPHGAFGKLRRFLGAARAPTLDHRELEDALKRRFRDRVLGEASTRLVIPAFMMPKTEIAVFKTDHHRDFRHDHATPAWQVARATSAAPTYLKGLEHLESGKIFIDGGLWANNPVMIALVDAMSAYDVSLDQIQVLSLGTGNAAFELNARQALSGWFAWREVIKAAMYLTTDNATSQVKLLLGPDRCIRIEPREADASIEMDDYDRAMAQLPARAALDFEAVQDTISGFFAHAVKPRERHYSK
jgi:patatin-like phospholipase/acyl hydrolase